MHTNENIERSLIFNVINKYYLYVISNGISYCTMSNSAKTPKFRQLWECCAAREFRCLKMAHNIRGWEFFLTDRLVSGRQLSTLECPS